MNEELSDAKDKIASAVPTRPKACTFLQSSKYFQIKENKKKLIILSTI